MDAVIDGYSLCKVEYKEERSSGESTPPSSSPPSEDEQIADASSSEDEQDDDASSSEDERHEDAGSSADQWQTEGEFPNFPFSNVRKFNSGAAESPYDFFSLVFNPTFMAILVSSINSLGLRMLLDSQTASYPHSRARQWKSVTVNDGKIFLGLLFHMGHIKLNGINDYWRTGTLFNLPFGKFMGRDKFLSILGALSFSDPSLKLSQNDPNKFVKPIVNFFNSLMPTLITPSKNLTIDESIVNWRGRLRIKQHIQGKQDRYRVKMYALSDTNGITQKMHMCCGSQDVDLRGQGHSEEVVMTLMKDYFNLGHSLYLDSFYTSVALAENLLDKKTRVTGNLRDNRSRNPSITKSILNRGSVLYRYNPLGVCVTNYRDKSNVIMISTEHSSEIVEFRNKRKLVDRKPKVIVEYNKFKKGIERKEQFLAYYHCFNKKTRWYKKIIFHVMQVMMINAFLMHDQQKRLTKNNSNSILSFYDYRLQIVEILLNVNKQTDRQTPRIQISTDNKIIHLPEGLPKNDKGKTKRKSCRYCFETKNIRKACLFYCPLCDKKPGLCIKCFRPYHNY